MPLAKLGQKRLKFECRVGGRPGGVTRRDSSFEPLDLGLQKADALGELGGRESVEVLAEFMDRWGLDPGTEHHFLVEVRHARLALGCWRRR